MSKRPDQRMQELEMEVARLSRELSRMNARPAQPRAPKDGWWMAVLQGTLNAQGTASAKIVVWDSGDAMWKYYSPAKTVTVQDFWMNDGESMSSPRRLKIAWYRNTWTWTNAYCDIADNLPSEE